MKLARIFRHLAAPHWLARRAFSRDSLKAVEAAVAASEKHHAGELRFVVEAGLPFVDLWRGVTPRERATELFSRLRVWDTAQNSGVLVYVQLIDRRVEIVADRGIAAHVAQEQWQAVCRGMEASFRSGAYGPGAVAAIARIGELLAAHFPPQPGEPAQPQNELPDRPLIL